MNDAQPADQPVDPKEAMRRALENKKQSQHAGEQGTPGSKLSGGPHEKAAAKRQFRRKSGG